MKNNSLRKRRVSRGEAKNPAVLAARAGYCEALEGKPLDCDKYATLIEQCNYEIGRLWALNLKAAAINAPKWKAGTSLTPTIRTALRRSFAAIGGCQPGSGDGRAEKQNKPREKGI